ncbi:uncharacterized protein LOC111085740 [Limulus polyphemus]|uniref:Uncharacterized protein LOC111085740 n=1 Tax=Limulus polyphemus TaxID=6850 RepID=A0ABM1SCT4_LIMPO|nr:uncharacterized protein LOC111085740 [Limulus polyphemus]
MNKKVFFAICILSIFTVVAGIFQTVQVCVNSMIQGLQSSCVRCIAGQTFTNTLNTCYGGTSLPVNSTQTQAFCLLTTCLSQIIGQQPQVIGRRKRSDEIEENDLETVETFLETNYDKEENVYD